jgi:hypothetical protein
MNCSDCSNAGQRDAVAICIDCGSGVCIETPWSLGTTLRASP